MFFCYRLPALDVQSEEFTEAAGTARWYYVDLATETILEDAGLIAESIRSTPTTPRDCTMGQEALLDLRAKVRKHIKNTYLKRIDAPVGVEPRLGAWMEVNGE